MKRQAKGFSLVEVLIALMLLTLLGLPLLSTLHRVFEGTMAQYERTTNNDRLLDQWEKSR